MPLQLQRDKNHLCTLGHISDQIKTVHANVINDGQAINQIHKQVSSHIRSTPMLEWILRENNQVEALASLTQISKEGLNAQYRVNQSQSRAIVALFAFLKEQDFLSYEIYELLVQNFSAIIYGKLKHFDASLDSFDRQAQAILDALAMGEKDCKKQEQDEKERDQRVAEFAYELSKDLECIVKQYIETRKRKEKEIA